MATLTIPSGGTGMVLISNTPSNVTWSTTQPPQVWVNNVSSFSGTIHIGVGHEVEVEFDGE